MPEPLNSQRTVPLPRVFLVGSHRGVGASTILLGLLVSLRRFGHSVGMSKLGASLVETTHHRRILSRLAYSLDPWMLDRDQLVEGLVRLAGGAEIAFIEGEGGLLDDLGEDSAYRSNAEAARALGTPIILVVDARGYREGLRALVRGTVSLSGNFPPVGVIANRIDDDEHNAVIRSAVEREGLVYLGGVRNLESQAALGTISGGVSGNPSTLTRARLVATGNLIESSLDRKRLAEIAGTATPVVAPPISPPSAIRTCRVAVADDQALHLLIQDNLDLVRRAGAELAAFSPLTDRKLPKRIDGIYLPGGYPHIYAGELSRNVPMLRSIREFVAAGGFIYAESTSLPYLCRRMVVYGGSSYEMVGLLPGIATAVVEDSVLNNGSYHDLIVTQRCPIGPVGVKGRGIRDGRWVYRLEEPVETALQTAGRGEQLMSESAVYDGFMPNRRVFATRLSIHWGRTPSFATDWVAALEQHAQARKAADPEAAEDV